MIKPRLGAGFGGKRVELNLHRRLYNLLYYFTIQFNLLYNSSSLYTFYFTIHFKFTIQFNFQIHSYFIIQFYFIIHVLLASFFLFLFTLTRPLPRHRPKHHHRNQFPLSQGSTCRLPCSHPCAS